MENLKKLDPEKESAIERAVGDYFHYMGLCFWKQPQAGYFDASRQAFRKHHSPYARNGVPDYLVVHKGRLIGVEIKTAHGQQTDSQKEFERYLKARGGASYYIVRSLDDAKHVVDIIKQL